MIVSVITVKEFIKLSKMFVLELAPDERSRAVEYLLKNRYHFGTPRNRLLVNQNARDALSDYGIKFNEVPSDNLILAA